MSEVSRRFVKALMKSVGAAVVVLGLYISWLQLTPEVQQAELDRVYGWFGLSSPKSVAARAASEKCDEMAKAPWDVFSPAKHPGFTLDEISPIAADYCRAAMQGNPDEPRLKYQLSRALRSSGDKNGLTLLKEAAEAEYPSAMLDFAMVHVNGIEAEKNSVIGAYWLKKTVSANLPAAINNLAAFYASEAGGQFDVVTAKRLFEKYRAHEQEFAEANLRAIENGDLPKSISDYEVATFCATDFIHGGNVFSGLRLDGVSRAKSTKSGSRVVAIGTNELNIPVPNGSGVSVKGRYGTLYMFHNGSFGYNMFIAGKHVDRFRYLFEDSSGVQSRVTLLLNGTTWFKNKSWLIAQGKVVGTDNSDLIVSYTNKVVDSVEALAGDDIINTWSGADEIDAGPGNDLLFGEQGPDKLKGGRGADIFVADRTDFDRPEGSEIYDTVLDFNPAEGDVIDLSGLFNDIPKGQKGYTPREVECRCSEKDVALVVGGKIAMLVAGGLKEPLGKLIASGNIYLGKEP